MAGRELVRVEPVEIMPETDFQLSVEALLFQYLGRLTGPAQVTQVLLEPIYKVAINRAVGHPATEWTCQSDFIRHATREMLKVAALRGIFDPGLKSQLDSMEELAHATRQMEKENKFGETVAVYATRVEHFKKAGQWKAILNSLAKMTDAINACGDPDWRAWMTAEMLSNKTIQSAISDGNDAKYPGFEEWWSHVEALL